METQTDSMQHPFPWRNQTILRTRKKKKIENSDLDHYGRSEASGSFSDCFLMVVKQVSNVSVLNGIG